MMKYIFAIPIYVLSKECLSRKVKQKERAIIEKRTNVYCQEGSKYMDRIISEECTPMNIWEFNHIIGYIKMMFGLSSISVIRLQNTIGQHIEKNSYGLTRQLAIIFVLNLREVI